MYLLFRDFHWTPMQFFGMGEGEKIVVRGFIAKYLQEKEKEQKAIEQLKRRK